MKDEVMITVSRCRDGNYQAVTTRHAAIGNTPGEAISELGRYIMTLEQSGAQNIWGERPRQFRPDPKTFNAMYETVREKEFANVVMQSIEDEFRNLRDQKRARAQAYKRPQETSLKGSDDRADQLLGNYESAGTAVALTDDAKKENGND